MNKLPNRRVTGVTEKHIGTFLTALILAAVLWNGKTQITLLQTVAVLQVEVSHMKDLLELSNSRAYTKMEAKNQINIFNRRFRENESRIKRLEDDKNKTGR